MTWWFVLVNVQPHTQPLSPIQTKFDTYVTPTSTKKRLLTLGKTQQEVHLSVKMTILGNFHVWYFYKIANVEIWYQKLEKFGSEI